MMLMHIILFCAMFGYPSKTLYTSLNIDFVLLNNNNSLWSHYKRLDIQLHLNRFVLHIHISLKRFITHSYNRCKYSIRDWLRENIPYHNGRTESWKWNIKLGLEYIPSTVDGCIHSVLGFTLCLTVMTNKNCAVARILIVFPNSKKKKRPNKLLLFFIKQTNWIKRVLAKSIWKIQVFNFLSSYIINALNT